jgi:hypothetical protein
MVGTAAAAAAVCCCCSCLVWSSACFSMSSYPAPRSVGAMFFSCISSRRPLKSKSSESLRYSRSNKIPVLAKMHSLIIHRRGMNDKLWFRRVVWDPPPTSAWQPGCRQSWYILSNRQLTCEPNLFDVCKVSVGRGISPIVSLSLGGALGFRNVHVQFLFASRSYFAPYVWAEPAAPFVEC